MRGTPFLRLRLLRRTPGSPWAAIAFQALLRAARPSGRTQASRWGRWPGGRGAFSLRRFRTARFSFIRRLCAGRRAFRRGNAAPVARSSFAAFAQPSSLPRRALACHGIPAAVGVQSLETAASRVRNHEEGGIMQIITDQVYEFSKDNKPCATATELRQLSKPAHWRHPQHYRPGAGGAGRHPAGDRDRLAAVL